MALPHNHTPSKSFSDLVSQSIKSERIIAQRSKVRPRGTSQYLAANRDSPEALLRQYSVGRHYQPSGTKWHGYLLLWPRARELSLVGGVELSCWAIDRMGVTAAHQLGSKPHPGSPVGQTAICTVERGSLKKRLVSFFLSFFMCFFFALPGNSPTGQIPEFPVLFGMFGGEKISELRPEQVCLPQ
ncbi:uncharacterized protein BP01DRAFT_93409 [Aspergillus saccharolyticus JOP 1030-1]|uniref:Uncharacterized protein n=1 Tax=Aspergillus saccharolyticus JOP 1030-1 TaxID=1450539 RepID=A0A318ZUQ3_9EURO|nr:hypothetical protein BP01DRAFT_93409 [Aspergillus saccharolyticus JOP 1030-1]PYH43818.1 hypothetical protein BP01DRAFT_93409 [Aspergillus saccharolyticus JOP 1030-1]